MELKILITFVIIVLVGGVVVVLAWWALADKFFPGTSRKTGQDPLAEIGLKDKPDAPAKVVKAFGDTQGRP